MLALRAIAGLVVVINFKEGFAGDFSSVRILYMAIKFLYIIENIVQIYDEIIANGNFDLVREIK